MRNKSVPRFLSSILLLSVIFSGCSSAAPTQDAPETIPDAFASPSETEAAEMVSETEQLTEAEETIELSGRITDFEPQQPEAPSEVEEASEETVPLSESFELIEPALVPLNGAAAPIEVGEPEECTQEEFEKLERAYRDYSGPDNRYGYEAYGINYAPCFYLYMALTENEQAIYNALQIAAMDPYAEELHVPCTVSIDPSSEEFRDAWGHALEALVDDHPEFFWLDTGRKAETRCISRKQSHGGLWTVYFYIRDIPSDLSVQIVRFNRQTQNFLDLIDVQGSQKDIAKKTHDVLIHNVSYDDPVAELNKKSVAHTAYGALLCNEDGEPFKAVCDGYSKAYLYLLQMQGISGAVISGFAGPDSASTGRHAWNLLNLDGVWSETDITWDDKNKPCPDDFSEQSRKYYNESRKNRSYMEKITHSMFCISSEEMTHFDPGSRYDYHTADGRYVYYFVGKSVHYRANHKNDPYMGTVMERMPIAF